MPEEPKDFPQSGADGSGQIGKQDWELPNSVSAPPDGFSPNVETASYGGYDESITDYHPPVEQGETLHPFKVKRFRDEDDTPMISVHIGRLFYSKDVSYLVKFPPHGRHNNFQANSGAGDAAHTHTVTATPEGDVTKDTGDSGLWPAEERVAGAHDASAYFGYVSSSLVSSAHASSNTPATGEGHTPRNFWSGVTLDVLNDFAYFNATEGASSVWLRYILDWGKANGADIEHGAGKAGVQVVYTANADLDVSGFPTNHQPIQPLVAVTRTTGATSGVGSRLELMRQNATGDFNTLEGFEGALSADARAKLGCYYIKIAELAAEGDEDTRPVTQLLHSDVFIHQSWVVPDGETFTKSGYGEA